MADVTERCENFLLSIVKKYPVKNFMYDASRPNCLELLALAQEYELKRLESACVMGAQDLSLAEFKRYPMYHKFNSHTYLKIVEGKIEKMEYELQNKCRCPTCLSHAKLKQGH